MTIHNRIGITSYQRSMTKRLAGSPAAFELPLTRAMRNPLRQQQSNVAIGTFDTDADSITITITEPDGTEHSYTVTRAAGSPVDAAAAAAAFETAINEDPAAQGVFSATSPTTNVLIVFDHAGIDYEVEATASAGTTATVTRPVDPAGTSIPIARFVALSDDAAVDGQRAVELPDGATAAQIVGLVMRPLGQFVNGESPLQSAVDSVPAGRMLDVAFERMVNVRNASAGLASEKDPVFVVVDDDGDFELGEALPGPAGEAQVSTIVPVVNHQFYGFKLVIGGRTFVATYNATDATTAVADAIDGLFDSIVQQLGGDTSAANGLGVTVTESDTELTFTTDEGIAITDLQNTVFNLDTEVATSVATLGAAGVNAVEINAYWAEDTPAGEVGPVMLRL